MSTARSYTIRCPRCGAESTVGLYDSIHVDKNPELRDALMANRLNAVDCSGCGFSFRVDKPLLYVDATRGFAVLWAADDEAAPDRACETFGRMEASLRETSGAPPLRLHLVLTRAELVERIFLIEAGFDERIIEYIKYMVFSNNAKRLDPAAKRLLFNAQDSTAEALCFVVQDIATRKLEGVLQYDRAAARKLEAMFAGNPSQPLSELFPGPIVSARRLMDD